MPIDPFQNAHSSVNTSGGSYPKMLGNIIHPLTAILFLLPGLYFWGVWFSLTTHHQMLAQSELVTMFLDFFPDALRDVKLLGYICAVTSVVGTLLSLGVIQVHVGWRRRAGLSVLFVGVPLVFLGIFSLL